MLEMCMMTLMASISMPLDLSICSTYITMGSIQFRRLVSVAADNDKNRSDGTEVSWLGQKSRTGDKWLFMMCVHDSVEQPV